MRQVRGQRHPEAEPSKKTPKDISNTSGRKKVSPLQDALAVLDR